MRALLFSAVGLVWAVVLYGLAPALRRALPPTRYALAVVAVAVAAAGANAVRHRIPSERTVVAVLPGDVRCTGVREPDGRTGLGSVDTIGDAAASSGVAVTAGSDLELSGWAALADGPAARICAILDGHVVAGSTGRYGGARPDVVAMLHDRRLLHVSFAVRVPGTEVAPGLHHVGAVAVDRAGRYEPVGPDRTITVTP